MLDPQHVEYILTFCGGMGAIGAYVKGRDYLHKKNGNGNGQWTKKAHDEVCEYKLKPIIEGQHRIEAAIQRLEDKL
jgi:hypothetical protein